MNGTPETDPHPEPPCSHDYKNCERKGRARYHCRKCDADITMDVVLLAEAGFFGDIDPDAIHPHRNHPQK